MTDDRLTAAEREALLDCLDGVYVGQVEEVEHVVASIKADAVDAALARIKHLPDEWERYSNEVSKFIDQEHADDLRAALAAVNSTNN